MNIKPYELKLQVTSADLDNSPAGKFPIEIILVDGIPQIKLLEVKE